MTPATDGKDEKIFPSAIVLLYVSGLGRVTFRIATYFGLYYDAASIKTGMVRTQKEALTSAIIQTEELQSSTAECDGPAVEVEVTRPSDDGYVTLTKCPETGHARTKAIPLSTWEYFRPVIEKLYVEEELRLSDVSEIMAQQHGFCAT